MKIPIVLILLMLATTSHCQEHEQQLETLAERDEPVPEDDIHWQQLHHWQAHPLNINAATEEELASLQLLTALQIHHLIQYRKLLGELINIYELQAVPTWDLATIKRLLPYITTTETTTLTETFRQRLQQGEQKLLLRISHQKTEANHLGNGLALMTRFSYQYKNLLQYGFTADKDAGEQFFKGQQSFGFDFYSFHVFTKNLHKIKTIALGDYTLRLGQGLIQWQGLAFKKSSSVLAIKRQAPVVQPYNAPGEYNFYRGAAITRQHKNSELTVFTSLRKFDANFDTDTTLATQAISSFVTTGYHRTELENSKKNNIQCLSYGGSLQWHSTQAHIGINTIHHHFSQPLQSSDKPYGIFGINGSSYNNYSIDYGYTFRNFHAFGEIAIDKHVNKANLHGLLASLHAQLDIAILYRAISRSYQSLFSNAFTENTLPVNEKGLYIGMVLRPATGLQLDFYADCFTFPWLRFKTNAPSQGQEYLIQLNYTPGKNVEVYTRFRYEKKTGTTEPKKNWRTQIACKPSRQFQVRSRVEAVIIGKNQQSGFLFFHDLQYKPAFKPVSINARLQYFETDGYDSRIYAMENLLQYSFSAPAFFNKAWRAVLSGHYRFKSRHSISFNFNLALAQTLSPSKPTTQPSSNTHAHPKQPTLHFQCIITRK